MEEYPSEGELVVCRVRHIEKYGVFVDLLEYNKEGFVHVSKITTGWVKNIRSHVSEGQIRVGYVVKVDKKKNLIDLSFRKVGPAQERRKMEEWKRAKHAKSLFERAARSIGEDPEKWYKKIVEPIEEEYGELYSALEACSLDGEKALSGIKIPKKWKEALVEVSKASVTVPFVTVRGTLTVQLFDPDGVDKIKEIAKEVSSEKVQLRYISAPNYSITVSAREYPEAEKILDEVLKKIKSRVEALGGVYEFKRD